MKLLESTTVQYKGNAAYRSTFTPNERDPVSHFIASVISLCKYALQNCDDSDMVGISILNEVNMRDKAIGISFRRKDQLSTDGILNVWQKVTHQIRVLTRWTYWSMKCIV